MSHFQHRTAFRVMSGQLNEKNWWNLQQFIANGVFKADKQRNGFNLHVTSSPFCKQRTETKQFIKRGGKHFGELEHKEERGNFHNQFFSSF